MRNPITWLDRFLSWITGHTSSIYANRRLAREDLHALEAQRARAVRRLTEDNELIDRYVNPLERYLDGDRLLTPLGTILDRRSGKNLPLVWTELDLREFRRWARVICDVNPFAVGFLGLLTDFHIRQGFGWQATTHRFLRKIGTGGTDTSREFSTSHSSVGIAQAVLDEWRDTQQWGLKSREAFRRWRRDGEVFIRFFRGGPPTRGLPVIRFVEPEQVGPPPGDDPNDEWSFGIRTDPQDVENVISYFVRDPLGTGSEGIEVPAKRILHLRANVDVSIKRGLPDFLPVQDDLERVRRMLRNMGEVAAIQSAIAWVSQYATATVDQVGTLIRAGSDYTRPKIGDPSGKYMDVVNYEPGTVLHMDNNRQFVAGPIGTGTPGFIQVEQAILRGCGARWRFPEYFSGDASNNNMASSIVAGSPFVVAVEGNQLEWGVFERAVAKKVLELCAESGRLSEELVAQVDVKVISPAVALANREEEERLREMRHKAGVLSVTTWQQQVGLDPKHEAANFEVEARRKSGGEEEKAGRRESDSSKSCECDEEVSEAKSKKGKGYTGMTPDSDGNPHCFVDGKPAHCSGKSKNRSFGNHSKVDSSKAGTSSHAKKSDAFSRAIARLPGHQLASVLRKHKAPAQAIRKANKLAQLEKQFQGTRRGSAESARLEKDIARHRREIHKLIKADADFVGTLRGVKQTLPGVKTKPIAYKKIDRGVAAKMRRRFDSTARPDFLKKISKENEAALKTAGLSDADIQMLKKGKLPEGNVYQVHHKIPLATGGTNDPSNLILIKNEPFHKTITNYQNELTRGMKAGETRIFDYPLPEGFVYPP